MNASTGQVREEWGRFAAWRSHHYVAAKSSWQKLIARPAATCLIVLVVAISMALPSAFLLTLHNLKPLTFGLGRPGQVSVMLDRQLDLAEAEALQSQVARWSGVSEVMLIRRDEALIVFGEQTGLSAVLTSLDRNPLPHALLVSLNAPFNDAMLGQLVKELDILPVVDKVISDNQWMLRLDQALVAGERWGLALGVAMILGAILALANTLYLVIEARREEILVVRMIGGSPGFIRRPFLYTGLYFGLAGGLLAALLLWVLGLWVAGPVNALFLLYDSQGQLQGPGLEYLSALIALGAAMGWLTAWTAVARYFMWLESC